MKREFSRLIMMFAALLIGLGVCGATALAINPDDDGRYPIAIGGTIVTEDNKDHISMPEGYVKYDPATNTLTFYNVTKKNVDANGEEDPTVEDGIWYFEYSGEEEDLNIELVGDNYIDCQSCGFFATRKSFVFKGTGTLTLNCVGPGSGVCTPQNITIEKGCTVNVRVKQGAGFQPSDKFSCIGTATVTGGYADTEGVIGAQIDISGTFTTTGLSSWGIWGDTDTSGVKIDGGTVSVNGIYAKAGKVEILNGSKVETNARYNEKVWSARDDLYGIAASSITIKDSNVTATSDMKAAIYIDEPNVGKVRIENSTVVAKSVPKEDETNCPGIGIHTNDGSVHLINSKVTVEGLDGIHTGWGEVVIKGGDVTVNGKGNSTITGYGIYVGYENLELTDATLTVSSTLDGIFISSGSYLQNGGELSCKGGLFALESIAFRTSTETQAEPIVNIETAADADRAVSTWDVLIASGTVSVKGGSYGIVIKAVDPSLKGLEVENAITKVVIEGTKQAILLEHDDVDKKIVLGDKLIIREPENGKVSADKHDFLDANDNPAKKVVIVKDCEISFEPEGGTGSMEGSSADSGSDYELPTCSITPPTGKGFAGWKVGSSEEIKKPGDKIPVSGNVTVKPVWEKLAYKISQGADGTWTGGDFEIIVKAEPDDNWCFENFLGVSEGGNAWTNGKEYTASKGSTKIVIKEATLKALSEGKHDIVIAFTGEEITTSLTLAPTSESENNGKVDSPKTGESTPYATILLIEALVCAGIGATVILCRRRARA